MSQRKEEEDPRPALPLLATAIALGIWISALVLLTFVVVPVLFSVCGAPA